MMPRLSLLAAVQACLSTPVVRGAFTLITFDVDGTLIRGAGDSADAHSRAFSAACGSVLGTGVPTPLLSEALPTRDYAGSTDGLILMRLARATLGVDPAESAPRIPDMMEHMNDYFADLTDEEAGKGMEPLAGVLDALGRLSSMKDRVACGLVTGNVEGIARRKMRAVGILDTGALSPPSMGQIERRWSGAESIGFLGGFGSDFCSGNIDDPTRNHLDRAEQIAIAARRCAETFPDRRLERVVHVGDAPADVLAAKACAEGDVDVNGVCVGMVAVSTGSYCAEELRGLAGKPKPGRWEPVVLEEGMADPAFLKACGVAE